MNAMLRITPDDVGKRVSVRSRTHAPPGEPSTTDTIGVLRHWDADAVHIERRDGTRARIPRQDLLAGRVVPDPPPRRPPR